MSTKDQHFDTVIIGGGIIGLTIAYYLTEKQKKVLLLEKQELGAGASGACDDMILLQSKKPGIILTLALNSLDLYRSLAVELPENIELETRGGMVLIETKEHLNVMEDFVKQQQSLGLDVKFLEQKEVRKLQPHVSSHVLASTYSPLDSQVNPLKTMRSLAIAGKQRGLQIKRTSIVKELIFKGDHHWEVKTDTGLVYSAENVVNAAGAWTPALCSQLGVTLPIRPKRGQIAVTEKIPALGKTNIWSSDYIVMKLNPELARSRKSIMNELGIGLSLAQTSDGNYFIGGSREYAGFDVSTDIKAINLIINEAVRFFPILKKANIIRTFAGLRPACDDGKPVIGPVTHLPGLFIASGHEGDGIALAPITGKIIANMITGTTTNLNVQELSPDRFVSTRTAEVL